MKKFVLAAALVAALLPSLATAQSHVRSLLPGPSTPVVETLNGIPLGFVSLPVPAAATPLAPPAGAVYALVSCTGANVMWRDDGGAPTAAIGMPIIAGAAPIKLTLNAGLQFIAQSGAPVLNVSYYK
jgi:hypothetical protein